MRVKDEALWQQLMADFAVDESPNAPILRQFFIEWAGLAESILGAEEEATSIDALRRSLNFIKGEHPEVWVPSQIVGAALALLIMHWEYGEAMALGMTEIETHLVQEMTGLKLAQLQQQAQEASNDHV